MSVEALGATKVLIIADDPLARAGLAALLATAPHVAVAGQSSSEADLAVMLSAFLPDVVLWDLGWMPEDPLATLGKFVEAHATPVVALLAVDALAGAVQSAGARGLLTRTSDAGPMAAALHAVVQGLLVFDETLLATPAFTHAPNDLIEPLSARELEVLRHLAEGLSNKEIARALAISENTIKFHVNAILGKLGAQSRTEAVVRATRAGLILL
ncbi:response regulator transcription factor [Caldilinea sp.]|uniref:response regulator transcription factor n=1 Tax=Caldilinea sp. TaxID=2293560 RepID=UPI002BD381E2|nr:response regulator transcription factor [Caldilinea sp.]